MFPPSYFGSLSGNCSPWVLGFNSWALLRHLLKKSGCTFPSKWIWRFADSAFSLFACLSTSHWTWEEAESKTGHAYYMFSFACAYAWIVKQSLFSCPWFHSVGGESNTMIEDEGAGGFFFFFPRWAPHGRWLLAVISLSAGVSVNPTLAPGILNARWRELSLKL